MFMISMSLSMQIIVLNRTLIDAWVWRSYFVKIQIETNSDIMKSKINKRIEYNLDVLTFFIDSN